VKTKDNILAYAVKSDDSKPTKSFAYAVKSDDSEKPTKIPAYAVKSDDSEKPDPNLMKAT